MKNGGEKMVIEYIKSDLYRYYGNTHMGTFLSAFFRNKTFRFLCIIRMCRSGGVLNLLGLFLYKINRNHNIQISYKTKIGYGLYIGHNGPVVVNPTAVIGDNCNLSQFVTIGSNEGKAATIGDNVYIGPNTCIVEDVCIGDNVTIGAGSVVTKSIPDNATAVGNYAKVINYNNPGKYIQNQWVEPK